MARYYIGYLRDAPNIVDVLTYKPDKNNEYAPYGVVEGPFKNQKEVIARLDKMNISNSGRQTKYRSDRAVFKKISGTVRGF